MNRKHDRFATCFDPVIVSFSGEVWGMGHLYDISYGGCKVESAITPPLGTSVTLRLRIDPKEQEFIIERGRVAWTMTQICFGVTFLELPPEEERALDSFLSTVNQGFLSSTEKG